MLWFNQYDVFHYWRQQELAIKLSITENKQNKIYQPYMEIHGNQKMLIIT